MLIDFVFSIHSKNLCFLRPKSIEKYRKPPFQINKKPSFSSRKINTQIRRTQQLKGIFWAQRVAVAIELCYKASNKRPFSQGSIVSLSWPKPGLVTCKCSKDLYFTLTWEDSFDDMTPKLQEWLSRLTCPTKCSALKL